MIYNTDTPYTNTLYGTANVTFNYSTLYVKSSHDLNDGTANYDMPLLITSSNASPVEVAVQINNGAKATVANAALIGTMTANDFAIMTNNSCRMMIKSSGLIGIGTTNPAVPLHMTSNSTYTWNPLNNVGITVYRLRTDSGATETAGGVDVPNTKVTAIFAG
jgi:mitochondrial fission protein ELM1